MALFSGTVEAASGAETFSAEQLDFFENRVRPILAGHCQECHGVKTQESELRLDTQEGVLAGGAMGPAVVPGHPDKSLLMAAVRYEELQMPPTAPLSDKQIALLERWIKMGAPWPSETATPALGDQDHIWRVAAEHWAFQPLQHPPVPEVANSAWVKTPIDAFVLQRFQAERLAPSERADRRTLIRRLSFDLIGLPPTPAEVEAFVNAESPDAYTQLVDRLLESPHYGEHWGRRWLDIARYADTRDWFPQVDTRYPYAYTYRDWVVSALNRDMPYDRFVRYQIAADQYVEAQDDPNLAALGFLTVGPRFRNNQHEQVADRIDVVTRGLLAMTATCARCHDHKYDPIPTADYYSLYGVFASSDVPEEFPTIRVESASAEQRHDYQQKLDERQADFDEYKQQLVQQAEQDLRKRTSEYLIGYYEMNVSKEESIRSLLSKRDLKETAMTPLASGLDRLAGQPQFKQHAIMRPWVELMGLADGKFVTALKKTLRNDAPLHPALRQLLEDKPPANRLELLKTYGDLFHAAWNDADRKAELVDVRKFLQSKASPFQLSTPAVVNASRLLGAGRRKLADFENAILQLEINHAGAPARAMVMQDKDKPVTPRVFRRGDPAQRGDAVPRQFLTVLAGEEASPFEDGSGRRELAEAITDPQNPLTARVIVNRLWMHHFGRGLVTTPGDFGLRSDTPSHPQLLDWLATYLIDNDWSLKEVHRLIVMSNVWQQAVRDDAKATAADPDNRWLWRANRRRLTLEQMRDGMLRASGQLDGSVGGRPVELTAKPYPPRRTLYGHIDRVNLDPMFTTFDFPTPDSSKPERSETLIPQQSLFQMNDDFVLQMARRLVATQAFTGLASNRQRVEQLYRKLFARQPSDQEIALTLRFVKQASQLPTPRRSPWQYGYGRFTEVSPADAESDRPVESGEPQGTVTFHPLPVFRDGQYQASEEYPHPQLGFLRLEAEVGQAGRSVDAASIRRWIAPVDARVRITGTLIHDRDQGDGVRGRVFVAGQPRGRWSVFHSQADTSVEPFSVTAGEAIDFMVDCQGSGSNDLYRWAPRIHVLETPAGAKTRAVWDAKQSFAAPQPPPFAPWEQVAQALMLTNEFIFID